MRNIRYETNLTRAYVQRRRDRGVAVNADEIWKYIRGAWPGLTDEEQEAIFQACDKPVHRRTVHG
jgi:hypothetical protein